MNGFSSSVFTNLVQTGEINAKPDLLAPSVPMDYDWARVMFQDKIFSYSLFNRFRIGTWSDP